MTCRSQLTRFDREMLRSATDLLIPVKGERFERIWVYYDSRYKDVTVELVYGDDLHFRSIRILGCFPTMKEALQFAWKQSRQGRRLSYSAHQVRKLSHCTREYVFYGARRTVYLRRRQKFTEDNQSNTVWQAYSAIANAAVWLHAGFGQNERRQSLRQALRIARS